jgi:heptosyltransferase-3
MAPGYASILLIQLGDIGDVVVTTPAIRAAKETFPAARVSILVRKPFGSLLAGDPSLHEVIESTRPRGSVFRVVKEYASFARRLRSARYDLVVDLRTGDRGAIFAFLTGAKERAGRPGKPNQFWHDLLFTTIIRRPVLDPNAHPGADQSLRIVRELGIVTKDSTPRLHVSSENANRASALIGQYGLAPGGKWITINPFSRWKYKEWDSAKWAGVIDTLWEGHRIPSVLVGSLEETEACQEICKGREDHAFNLAGRTTLGELAALLSMATLHLGVDSAGPHVAAAVGTPTVTLHGPSDWRGWSIVDDLHRIVAAPIECVPCSRRGCEDTGVSRCMEQLDARTVMGVIEEILQKLPAKLF